MHSSLAHQCRGHIHGIRSSRRSSRQGVARLQASLDVSHHTHHHSQQYLPDESGRNPLASAAALPLAGKRIIVTAPRQYSEKLCSKLVAAGSRPMWVPGVSIAAIDPEFHPRAVSEFDSALRSLMKPGHGYTHIAFTSKNGIYAVLQRLAHLTGGGLDEACQVLDESRASLCALGADGAVLTKAGLALNVSPREASTQGLVKELEARGEARGAKILCPVPLVTGGLTEPPVVPRFLAALEAAGAHPVRVCAYETTLGSTADACQAERMLLAQGHVAAIAFSSTAEAQGLVQVMGLETITQAVKQHGVVLAAHGPYTAQGASQVLGLPVPCVSKAFGTFDGLVHALEAYFTPGEDGTPGPSLPHNHVTQQTSISNDSFHRAGSSEGHKALVTA